MGKQLQTTAVGISTRIPPPTCSYEMTRAYGQIAVSLSNAQLIWSETLLAYLLRNGEP